MYSARASAAGELTQPRLSARRTVARAALPLLLCLGLPLTVHAWTPLQLSLSPRVQAFPRTTPVYGLRLSLPYGESEVVEGLDLGFYTTPAKGLALEMAGVCDQGDAGQGLSVAAFYSRGSLTGLSLSGLVSDGGRQDGIGIAGVYSNLDEATGLQIAGVVSMLETANCLQIMGWAGTAEEMVGVQVGGCGNLVTSRLAGVQLAGILNLAESGQGLQIASAYNLMDSMDVGVQIGCVNHIHSTSRGVQIGVINYSPWHEGVQIGLLNINRQAPVPVFPGLNVAWGLGDRPPCPGGRLPEPNTFIEYCIVVPAAVLLIGGVAILDGLAPGPPPDLPPPR